MDYSIVDYEESFGEIKFPEGFAEKLKGKSIEEQMECYRITESYQFSKTAYGEVTNEKLYKCSYGILDYPRCVGLVMKENTLVGVLIKGYFSQKAVPCLPYKSVCVYYASDNDGAGTDDREDNAYLICV